MENQQISIELSRLCRTCAAERSHLSPLFAQDSNVSRRLDDMLMSCTNLKVLEADGFPNSICNICVDELKSAYRFQQHCETADRYYKQLRLKSNSDCTQATMVFNEGPNYDYIEMFENNSIVFRCRECCQAFNTIRELKNHKLIHSKNEVTEEKHEFLSVEMNHEEEIDGGGDEDSNSSFLKKFNNCDTEEDFEMVTIPMASEIKEEELSTFIDIVIKEEKENSGKGECNMSNLFLEQSYQKDSKKLEVVAIQKEIEKESLLEVLKETNACPNSNVKCSSGDNRDEDYFPSDDSDTDYFPDQTHRIDIGTKNQKHLNTRQQHQLTKKLNSPKTDRSRILQCTDCGQEFEERKALQEHSLLHSCRVHIQRLTYFNYPKGHTHDSEQRLFKCDIQYHEQTHNSNTRFKCDVCEKSFTCSSRFSRHKRLHNPTKRFKCDMCEKSFKRSSYLSRHKWLHNPTKRFKCDVCEKSFIYKDGLQQHMWTHNPNKRFKCDVCEKLFTYNSALTTHKLLHSANKRMPDSNKRFKCDICEKLFVNSRNLRRHQLTHNSCTPFKCDMCGKSFSCSWNLEEHKWTHNPNKRYKCNNCGRLFTHSKNLKRHQLTHNACTPFKCDMCEKSFSSSWNLQEHKWTHNPNKRLKCDVCEKSFIHYSHLRSHKLTHIEDKRTHDRNKRFKCDICEKLFTRSANLRRHQLTHNAYTPFKCDMCEKSFSCSWNLQEHKWTHNPNKRFKCDFCEKLFTHGKNLRRHQLTHNDTFQM